MRLLTLCSALAQVSAGVVEDDRVLAERAAEVARGQPGRLVWLVRELLTEGWWTGGERGVAVTVGPGGFTGIRAALALAHGLGAGAGVPVIGVTVGEALAAERTGSAPFPVWTAVDSRRGQVFLEIDGQVRSVALADLPPAPGAVEVLGDAADSVAVRLRAAGVEASIGARWPA
ncbi:MAG: tRNA (adenosine(37)-N6)-threonylcarbamoyltransferase complex dimerization subunit type 1 TsaB, partial [Solirubrobacteraceae bacterium]